LITIFDVHQYCLEVFEQPRAEINALVWLVA